MVVVVVLLVLVCKKQIERARARPVCGFFAGVRPYSTGYDAQSLTPHMFLPRSMRK